MRSTTWRSRWWPRSCGPFAVMVVLAVLLGLPGSAAAAQIEPPPDAGPCNAQAQALYTAQQAIERHNAQPHEFLVPQQQAALVAYDAEAVQLDAAQAAALTALDSCVDALDSLGLSPSTPPEFATTPTPRVRDQLEQARANVPPDHREAPPPPGTRWEIPRSSPLRPLYETLRQVSPSRQLAQSETVELQGRLRPRIGDPDPSRPGRVILGTELANGRVRSSVSPDHIVSLAEIVTIPGFARLTPENQLLVANSPVNLQWLSWETNRAKSSRSARDLTRVDPRWQAAQGRLEDQVRGKLVAAVEQLLRSQG